MKNICAIYLRLSDEDRNKESKFDDSESIKNQRTMLVDYASKNEFEIFDIYSDDDFSGADISKPRPDYTRLLKDAEGRKFNIVLCKSQSRFTRDMAHVEYYIHNKFLEWGIRFIGVADHADTNDIANKKTRQITGLTNEWYLEDLSRNVKTSIESKKSHGQFVGAYPCFGYLRDPQDKNKLIIDEEAANVVKRIFEMYLSGMGCASISSKLNAEGVLTPSMYKLKQGIFKTASRKGSQSLSKVLWDNSCVAYILHQQMYTGDMIQNKEGTVSYKNKKKKKKDKSEWIIVKNTHPAIIDKEAFEKAQKIAGTRTRPLKSGVIHPYSGIIKCGECGGIMIRSKDRPKKNGESAVNYRCVLHGRAKDHCVGSCITESKLNSIVIEEINKIIVSYNEGELNEKLKIDDTTQEKIQEYKSKIKDIDDSIELSNKAINELYLDKVKGIITEEQFVNINNSFVEKNNEDKRIKSVLLNQIEELEKKKNRKTDNTKLFEKYKNVTEVSRELIQDFISAIYVKNTGKVNQKEIRIEWNF